MALPIANAARPWTLHVLATTHEGTRCALAAARRLTHDVEANVVLLVPRLMSLRPAFDPANEERAAIVDEYRAIAAEVGVHVTVLFCVCHRPEDVVHQMVGTSALVIVGGRDGGWWPSRERRLADRLTGAGHPVVFADTRAALEPALATS